MSMLLFPAEESSAGGRAEPRREPDLLLVEDSADDAELALHALAQSGLKARTHWVRDGQEALEWIGRNPPRVVLLDLKMPRLDGFEVLRRLKQRPDTAAVPVIVMVSGKDAPELEACTALGADGHLVKPLQVAALRELARRLALH
ncbi:MAG: response regulator [Pseudomonadota bacterium]|nr:MAG: two-component system response regulator [Pseudomonadota bacterium]